MLVGSETKVLESFSGILWSSQEKNVASSWGTESQLIEGQSLTTGSENAGTGGSGEAESSNAELWDGQKTVVVSDGTDDGNGLVVRLLGCVGHDAREGDRWSVGA